MSLNKTSFTKAEPKAKTIIGLGQSLKARKPRLMKAKPRAKTAQTHGNGTAHAQTNDPSKQT